MFPHNIICLIHRSTLYCSACLPSLLEPTMPLYEVRLGLGVMILLWTVSCSGGGETTGAGEQEDFTLSAGARGNRTPAHPWWGWFWSSLTWVRGCCPPGRCPGAGGGPRSWLSAGTWSGPSCWRDVGRPPSCCPPPWRAPSPSWWWRPGAPGSRQYRTSSGDLKEEEGGN